MQTNDRLVLIDIAKRRYTLYKGKEILAVFEDSASRILSKEEVEQIRNLEVNDRA